MIEPDSGRGIPGVSVPAELYWVLMTPAPLAGMKYPRQGFSWRQLAVAGFARLVALHPGSYDPSPLSILCSEKLQDLVGGGLPRNPDLERETIERVVRLVVEALRVGDGVVIHCVGGARKNRHRARLRATRTRLRRDGRLRLPRSSAQDSWQARMAGVALAGSVGPGVAPRSVVWQLGQLRPREPRAPSPTDDQKKGASLWHWNRFHS